MSSGFMVPICVARKISGRHRIKWLRTLPRIWILAGKKLLGSTILHLTRYWGSLRQWTQRSRLPDSVDKPLPVDGSGDVMI
jgi:hypothetical protein